MQSQMEKYISTLEIPFIGHLYGVLFVLYQICNINSSCYNEVEEELMMLVIYDLGNIADWLSAIGTIVAVIVALYLARKEEKPRAKVNAGFNYTMSLSDGPSLGYISLGIVNTGKIPIHLDECSIIIGKSDKEKLAFIDGSHNVDKLLNPGEYYEHKLKYEPIKNFLLEKGIKEYKTHIFFKDSLGKKYKTKIMLRV